MWNRERVLGIVTRVRHDFSGFKSREGQKTSLQIVHIGCEVQPASYSVRNFLFTPGLKRPDREVYRSLPASAGATNECRYTDTPPV